MSASTVEVPFTEQPTVEARRSRKQRRAKARMKRVKEKEREKEWRARRKDRLERPVTVGTRKLERKQQRR